MARSRSSSSSNDDGDSSASDSGSEASSSSYCGSKSSSSSLASSTALSCVSDNGRSKPVKDSCDALAVERMEREQRLRRLLSQRKVGDATPIDDGKNMEPFTFRRGALNEDDGVLLSTFTNASLFGRLLALLSQYEHSARSHSLDEVLAAANPLFYRNFKATLEDAAAPPPLRDGATVRSECAQLDHSGIIVHRRKREKSAHAVDRDAGVRRRRVTETQAWPHGGSATSGIIAKSLQNWEQHLSAELKQEGVSLESFRQQRHDSSYLEERRFLQDAQWADYQRELQLEEKRREQEAKRTIRRGESDAI
ncbi:hypothetical protein DQ04_02461090 [Trypanosoma grayi]|uniref:hypothetical protein n=1 Tax=Trypanosoma grayi TaxID=71804 RepID=UPI0004F4740D|nr:hypothetical protein DQ04_02461090 [Trypanosoma grayi]KEG11594.1 hypothetical protein DQ04_02461090 [Trypanosoma grayi]